MIGRVRQYWAVWRRATALAAPVTVEKFLRALMRTTDVLVAGLFSPAAVAAVGIGDSFSRIVNRVGAGLGGGTIALSSQDTGADAHRNRDEAITQALLLGVLVGIPFALFGLTLSRAAVALLGAEPAVVRMGAQYLALIMAAAPLIHVSYIGAKALQGTGDTRTPMYVRGFANVVNIFGTIALGLGIGPFPRLSVVGIALATVIGETIAAVLFVAVIYRPASETQFVWPRDRTITTQLVRISVPRTAEGAVMVVADLPFNAVLLAIGTEANAAYHIGRRVYRQLLTPFRNGFGVAANVLVGQSLGEDTDAAYRRGVATTMLSVLIAVALGVTLFLGGPAVVPAFTDDPTTQTLAIGFVYVFTVAGVFHAGYGGFQGALRGGSDTRTPFLATSVGMFVFLLGTSYVVGLQLGYGVWGVYLAIVLDFCWRACFLSVAYYRRNWINYGTTLMADRGSIEQPQ